MFSLWSLHPQDRTSFATAARFLSCLTTESLLNAVYLPTNSSHKHLTGVALILSPRIRDRGAPYLSTHIFAVVPLRNVPIFKPGSQTEIGLLDPLDMLPFIYEVYGDDGVHSDFPPAKKNDEISAATLSALVRAGYVTNDATVAPTVGPLHLWKKYADALDVDEDMQEAVAAELSSSVLWQQYSYEHPPPEPTFDSPSIIWEQCIIEGHPTHPMHKARRTIEPTVPLMPGEYDWYHPRIRMVSVPRSRMNIQGPWDDLVAPVRADAAKNAKADVVVPEDHILVPVHELQIPNIREKFPEAHVFPVEFGVDALAQQSIRSVLVPTALRTQCLKLAFGVRLTSAMRTISPPSAFLGPRFSSTVVPLLTYDRSLLVVQRELGSVSHVDPDPEIAKHFAGIVREAYENTSVEDHGERVIVCTALTEMGHRASEAEVPLVQTAFGLDTEEKRLAWLDTFIDVYLRAFLPSVLANGVAFEAHPQNTLARFDAKTRALKGFVIRDFGGLRIHGPSLLASTGLASLDDYVAPGHSVIADTLEDVHTRLYHTVVHNHLQQLIRVLGLHYNGKGWEVLRRHLRAQLPPDHELAKLWLAPETTTLPGKCFMRMRLQGMYRTHLHGPFPNLIHYKGDGREVVQNGV